MLEPWLIPRGFRARLGPEGLEIDRDPDLRAARRVRGVLDSLHRDILAGCRVRVRQVIEGPVDVFRLELERPDLCCRRTTLLDREAMEMLLEEVDQATVEQVFDFP